MIRKARSVRRRELLKSALVGAVGAALAPASGSAAESPPSDGSMPRPAAGTTQPASHAVVKVYVSCAVEDFVAPRSDDIIMEVARILTRLGVRASLHLTGDKIRTLVARGRKDVIDAIGEHVVGYHTNTHGVRPFLGHLLDNQDWDASVRDVLATEAPGACDVRNAFGRMPAYFVSEFAKGPQLIQAYKLMGVTSGVMVSSLFSSFAPAVWLCGSLLLSTGNLIALEHPPDTPDRLKTIMSHIDERLARAGSSDGTALAFLHPYKYACHPSKSWGAWNASYRGAASPAGPLDIPPMFPEAVTADLLDQFERLVRYMKAKDDVVFVDHAEFMSSFRDSAGSWVHRRTLSQLAKRCLDRLDYVVTGGQSYSAAEVFGLLVRALARCKQGGGLPEQVMVRPLLGPVRAPVQRQGVETDGRAVVNACAKLDHQLDETGRVPAGTPVLYVSLGPGTLLRAMARVYLELAGGGPAPEVVAGVDGPELPETSQHEFFQEKTFTHGDLYPDGFAGEQVCKYSLWQSWSLKPAIENS